jgi:hypothetical protein
VVIKQVLDPTNIWFKLHHEAACQVVWEGRQAQSYHLHTAEPTKAATIWIKLHHGAETKVKVP